MKRIDRLKREAKESTIFREHKMERFYCVSKSDGLEYWISDCAICNKWVMVCNEPGPNEIEICGSAIGLYCEIKLDKK